MVSNELRLVFWETTAACNLRCRHCRRLNVADRPSQADLTTEQARQLVSAIRRVGRPILVLSGGEPLLRPDIFELARFAADADLPTALASNGTMIDQAAAERIKRAGIRRVSVSLDGPDELTHDRLRGESGSFTAACDALRRLRAAGVSTQVNCTVARHNVEQLDRLYELAVGLGVDALHLFMLVPVGCGAGLAESQMLSADRYEQVLNWLYDRGRQGRLAVKATCAPHYYRIARQRLAGEGGGPAQKGQGLDAMTRGCLAGSAVCFVSHAGDVFPCGYLPIACGNVKVTEFARIWRDSPVFARLRDPGQLAGKCGACEFARVCMGCRARAYSATGDYMGEEPYCSFVPRRMRNQEP